MKLVGMAFGAGFGFVLGWARLTDYDVIHDMLLLREPDLFLLIGAAVATAATAMRVLRALGARSLIGKLPISWSVTRPTRNHVFGSVLFGLGWAVSGTCPGPVAAQLGRGQLAALFTLVGIMAGIVLCGVLKSRAAQIAAPIRGGRAIGLDPGL